MTDTVQKIEENIKQARQIIELQAALDRLATNKDFKLVITEGYLKQEAIRLVHLKAEAFFQTLERQSAIVRDIDGIGSLVSYFTTLRHNAETARKAIEADEFTRDEILSEGEGQ